VRCKSNPENDPRLEVSVIRSCSTRTTPSALWDVLHDTTRSYPGTHGRTPARRPQEVTYLPVWTSRVSRHRIKARVRTQLAVPLELLVRGREVSSARAAARNARPVRFGLFWPHSNSLQKLHNKMDGWFRSRFTMSPIPSTYLGPPLRVSDALITRVSNALSQIEDGGCTAVGRGTEGTYQMPRSRFSSQTVVPIASRMSYSGG
jgi:hypothetical protein